MNTYKVIAVDNNGNNNLLFSETTDLQSALDFFKATGPEKSHHFDTEFVELVKLEDGEITPWQSGEIEGYVWSQSGGWITKSAD